MNSKVCFFGIFDKEYSRNRVLIKGFEENGYEIILCKIDPHIYRGFSKFIQLYKEYKKISKIKFEYIIVAFPGHSVVWLAYMLFGKKIIFDAFVSLYDSNVYDRRLYSRFSMRALKDWILDFYSCHISYRILLDTNTHIDYFLKTFFVKKDKFIRVFVGTDDRVMYPQEAKTTSEIFTVHFHGSYIPLQGVSCIVKSAILLKNENIIFRLIGNEKMHKDIQREINNHNLRNIQLINKVPFERLSEEMAKAHICLGIFGDSKKANMVIPNKVYEAMACGKAVITRRSQGTAELFIDRENILLVEANNENDLTKKIIELKDNIELRDAISHNALNLYKENLNSRTLVQNLLNELQ